jgi:hypothetical protein
MSLDVEIAGDRSATNSTEIEIAPEMIEAGTDVFYDLPELLGPSAGELRASLRRAFSVMVQVQRAHRPAD